jgi:hypothetical protein
MQSGKVLDVDTSALKQQADAWAEKAQYFQKKFEDTQALWEEATRQKQRLQAFAERSPGNVNLEVCRPPRSSLVPIFKWMLTVPCLSKSRQYLKNVMMKYIESHNASEKASLVPVLAAVLQFSPAELQKAQAAHAADDGVAGGLLGGVFSLFGASPAAVPPPKPLAMPANFRRSPSSSLHGDYVEEDEDDGMAVLNPFAV